MGKKLGLDKAYMHYKQYWIYPITRNFKSSFMERRLKIGAGSGADKKHYLVSTNYKCKQRIKTFKCR
jgi:hypothetical protein